MYGTSFHHSLLRTSQSYESIGNVTFELIKRKSIDRVGTYLPQPLRRPLTGLGASQLCSEMPKTCGARGDSGKPEHSRCTAAARAHARPGVISPPHAQHAKHGGYVQSCLRTESRLFSTSDSSPQYVAFKFWSCGTSHGKIRSITGAQRLPGIR